MFKKTLLAVLIAATTATSLTPLPAFAQDARWSNQQGNPPKKRVILPGDQQKADETEQGRRRPDRNGQQRPAPEQGRNDEQRIDDSRRSVEQRPEEPRRSNESERNPQVAQERRGDNENRRRRPYAPDNTPSANQIERSLDAAPRMRVRPQDRVTVREFKRRPDLRRSAPSIEIQSINYDFGSALVPRDQYDKVERIADGMRRVLRRNRGSVFLIEGHTDAVGSFSSNQVLSERRAESLRTVLIRDFGVPSRALETVGYGEEFLLVNTQNEEWRNRRVTLRRIDAFVR